MNKLPVSEQFYSIQGEGRTVGIPSYFLRLRSCNLLCGGPGTDKDGALHNGATWRCDTIEVWLKGVEKTFDQVINDFGDKFTSNLNKGSHLIFTGGEPALHQESIISFMWALNHRIRHMPVAEIETNGTINLEIGLLGIMSHVNVSPKLANSGVVSEKRYKPDVLRNLSRYVDKTIFKFVISDKSDIYEAMHIINECNIKTRQVYLMPGADNDEDLQEVSEKVVDLCLRYGFNFSPRLHIAIWNKKTGV